MKTTTADKLLKAAQLQEQASYEFSRAFSYQGRKDFEGKKLYQEYSRLADKTSEEAALLRREAIEEAAKD